MTIQANQGFGVSVFGATGSGGGGTTSPGGSSLQIQYNAAGSFGGMAGTSWDNTNRSLTLTGATVTTSNPVLNLSQTWNAGAVTFKGWVLNVTDTASASASLLIDLQVGGSSLFSVDKSANVKAKAIYSNTGGSANGFFLAASSGTQIVAYTNNGTTTNSFATGGFKSSDSGYIGWTSSGDPTGAPDTYLTRNAAASLRLGAADAAAPVAQTLGVQGVVAGTSNRAGADFTIRGSQSTGDATTNSGGGKIIFQVSPPGASGTGQNAFATALTIASNRDVTAATSIIGTTAVRSDNGFMLAGQFYLRSDTNPFSLGYSDDVKLYRDAANTLALRNGTSAQTLRSYRSYTNASNYSRLALAWNTTTALVMAEGAGTGSDGSVAFNDAALATNATVGFVMIPSCAGTPSGTPADIPTGQIPMVWDSTNLKLYVYTGGAWKASAAFT